MKLIIGLGNPGKEYENTRHNVGFRFLDFLQKKLGLPDFRLQKKFEALLSEGEFSGAKFLLAKPQTFMNNSGQSVRAMVQFHKIRPEDCWLVYDDVDLPLGQIRIRSEGSAGTHNGMRSVIAELGFQNFPRLRIGIESRGVTASKEQDVASFVLHAFSQEEEENAKKVFDLAVKILLEHFQERVKASTFSL